MTSVTDGQWKLTAKPKKPNKFSSSLRLYTSGVFAKRQLLRLGTPHYLSLYSSMGKYFL
jgi:hypothetical protein